MSMLRDTSLQVVSSTMNMACLALGWCLFYLYGRQGHAVLFVSWLCKDVCNFCVLDHMVPKTISLHFCSTLISNQEIAVRKAFESGY